MDNTELRKARSEGGPSTAKSLGHPRQDGYSESWLLGFKRIITNIPLIASSLDLLSGGGDKSASKPMLDGQEEDEKFYDAVEDESEAYFDAVDSLVLSAGDACQLSQNHMPENPATPVSTKSTRRMKKIQAAKERAAVKEFKKELKATRRSMNALLREKRRAEKAATKALKMQRKLHKCTSVHHDSMAADVANDGTGGSIYEDANSSTAVSFTDDMMDSLSTGCACKDGNRDSLLTYKTADDLDVAMESAMMKEVEEERPAAVYVQSATKKHGKLCRFRCWIKMKLNRGLQRLAHKGR